MVAILISRLRNDFNIMKRQTPNDYPERGAPPQDDDVRTIQQPRPVKMEDSRDEPQTTSAAPSQHDAAAAAATMAAVPTTVGASMSDITYNKSPSFDHHRDEQRSAFSSIKLGVDEEAEEKEGVEKLGDEVVPAVGVEENIKHDQQHYHNHHQQLTEAATTPSPPPGAATNTADIDHSRTPVGKAEEPLPFESPIRYYQQQQEEELEEEQEQGHTTARSTEEADANAEYSNYYPPINQAASYPPHYQGYPPYGYQGYYHPHPPPPPPPDHQQQAPPPQSDTMGSSPQYHGYPGYPPQEYSPHHHHPHHQQQQQQQQQEYNHPYSYYPPGHGHHQYQYSQHPPHPYYPGHGASTPSAHSPATHPDSLKETPSAVTESTKGTTPSSMARGKPSSSGEGGSLDLSPSHDSEVEIVDDRKPSASSSADHRGRKRIKGILKNDSPRQDAQGFSDFEPIPLNEISAIPVLSSSAAGMDTGMDQGMEPPSPPPYAAASATASRHSFTRQFPHGPNSPPPTDIDPFAALSRSRAASRSSAARSSAAAARSSTAVHVAPPAPRTTPTTRRTHQRTIAPSSSGSTASSAGNEGGSWERRFGELTEFKRVHGHCEVPQNYAENASLGTWVNKQRMEQKNRIEGKNSSLNDQRLERLQSIDFRWAKRKGQASWNEKFNELQTYKARFGNCHVPTKYKENTALGRWVSTQRAEYKKYQEGAAKTSMNPDKIRRLEGIGFAWFMAL